MTSSDSLKQGVDNTDTPPNREKRILYVKIAAWIAGIYLVLWISTALIGAPQIQQQWNKARVRVMSPYPLVVGVEWGDRFPDGTRYVRYTYYFWLLGIIPDAVDGSLPNSTLHSVSRWIWHWPPAFIARLMKTANAMQVAPDKKTEVRILASFIRADSRSRTPYLGSTFAADSLCNLKFLDGSTNGFVKFELLVSREGRYIKGTCDGKIVSWKYTAVTPGGIMGGEHPFQ